MAGGTMDLKKEGITGVEAPPMDVGENLEAGTEEAPVASGEHLPAPPCEDLHPISTSADAAPELCDPGPAPAHHGPDPRGETEWTQAPQEARPQAGHQPPGNVLEEPPQPAQPQCSSTWAPGTSDGEVRQGPSDLAEEEEAAVAAAAEADRIQLEGLLAKLQRLSPTFRDPLPSPEDGFLPASDGDESGPLLTPVDCQGDCAPCPLHVATGRGLGVAGARQRCGRRTRSLLSAETDSEDLLSLLRYEGGVPSEAPDPPLLARSDGMAGSGYQKAYRQAAGRERPPGPEPPGQGRAGACPQKAREAASPKEGTPPDTTGQEDSPKPELDCASDPPSASSDPNKTQPDSFSALKEVLGPCDPEDLLDGVIFGAKYLGSTQLLSERNPPSSVRMAQAQEAVDTVKAPEGESQPMTEVDLFISTQRIKVLTADSQEAMMDHPLQTISYIADIGSIVVLMARRKVPHRADAAAEKRVYRMICHVFHSADAPVIARAIGQAFSVAYQRFLHSSGIEPGQVCPRRCDDSDGEEIRLPTGEEMYNGDLAHFSKQENCKEVIIPKQKGEILGVVIVESGWGSILPTVVIANLMHRGAAERSGKLSIGDRIMSINGTSLVGLPLATCQNIIRDLKSHTEVTLNVVHCPPVTTAIVRRPDTKYPLGFCVENGIICSLMRGGIAERGGIRVGHRIIEINGQSVVAMPHEKIIQILQQAVSEVRIKTMPASTYRLLTGQEQPVFL